MIETFEVGLMLLLSTITNFNSRELFTTNKTVHRNESCTILVKWKSPHREKVKKEPSSPFTLKQTTPDGRQIKVSAVP